VIDATPLLHLGLLLVRPGTLVLAAPPFGATYAPPAVKVGLTVLLALTLVPVVDVPASASAVALAGTVVREFAIGLALALAVRALVGAAEFGGHLIGFQMGLGYSAIVDPQAGVRNNLLAALYANVAVVTFLITNGHHVFLRGLRDSYTRLPIGVGHVGDSLPLNVASLLGLIFTLGVRLAAPVVVVLIVTELAMALMARSAPALNLMADGASVRLIIGMLLLAVVVPAAFSVLTGYTTPVLEAGAHAADAFR
jgi:flagellar biosynthetic protein FliR